MSSRSQHSFGKVRLAFQAIANVFNRKFGRKFISFFLVSALITVSMTACTSSPTANTGSQKGLVSFAVTKQAHANIIPTADREGNPKNIKTWSDPEKNGISLITADPKTSGVARWNFLAIWNSALKANNKNEAKTIDTLAKVFTK
jgi:ABC-type sulfate transport system substrate-binding protein